MLEFNNNHIFTGYIKQLLASFNLPSYRIYDEKSHQKNQEIIKNLNNYYDSFEVDLEYLTTEITKLKQLQTDENTNPQTDLGQSLDELENSLVELEAQCTPELSDSQRKRALELLQAGRSPKQVNDQLDNDISTDTSKKHLLLFSEKNKGKFIAALQHDHLIPTIYRNDAETYTNHGLVSYPVSLRYAPYIKDGKIQLYVQSVANDSVSYTWCKSHADFDKATHKAVHSQGNSEGYYSEKYYIYNRPERNYSKTLPVINNEYDVQTHEYLGNYLRFLRDYNKIDLMSLYNCFSNNICEQLDVTIAVTASTSKEDGYSAVFKSNADNYKIYMIPVQMFKEYTIALDSSADIEMFCGLYGKYYNSSSAFQGLATSTYSCMSGAQFSKPQLFTKLKTFCDWLDLDSRAELAELEDTLKLFIKIPNTVASSIVILEGDYCNAGDSSLSYVKDNTGNKIKKTLLYNKTVLNFEHISEIVENDSMNLISQPQLLRINSGISHPFADRLIEYLTGNAITSLDEIGDNVLRVKTVMNKRLAPTKSTVAVDQLWTDDLKYYAYAFMTDHKTTASGSVPRFSIEKTHDCLGYIDKDVETCYTTSNTLDANTIASIDVYNDEWE